MPALRESFSLKKQQAEIPTGSTLFIRSTMKPLPLIFSLLLLLTIPMVSGDTVSAQLSSGGPGAPETPPVNASVYITDAKAAVAERNWTNALLLTTRV